MKAEYCLCGKLLRIVHEDSIPEWYGISGLIWRHADGSKGGPMCGSVVHKIGAEERHACGKGEVWEGQTEHWIEVSCHDCLKIMEAAGFCTAAQAVKCFETPIRIGHSVHEIIPSEKQEELSERGICECGERIKPVLQTEGILKGWYDWEHADGSEMKVDCFGPMPFKA